MSDVNLNEVSTTYTPTNLLDRIRFNRFSSGKDRVVGSDDFSGSQDVEGLGSGWSQEDITRYGGNVETEDDGTVSDVSMEGVPPTVSKPNWAQGISNAFRKMANAKTPGGTSGGLMGRLKY